MAEAIPRLQRSLAMNIMRSQQRTDRIESYSSEKVPLCHRCPVCGTDHEVSAVRAQFAYGRQLACSPDCEAERRRQCRASWRRAPAPGLRNVLAESGLIARHPVAAGRRSVPLKLMISERESFSAESKTTEATRSGVNCTKYGTHRDGRDSQPNNTRRLAPEAEHKAVISVTVESADMLRVRKAIFQAGGEAVGILKTAPVPHSSQVRVFVGMKVGVLDSIMLQIMRSVTACEFGRVVRL
jgi:hypothetical protein